jgi:class 3 adenylate cyclase/DNA-binding SARP family transcriptional activator
VVEFRILGPIEASLNGGPVSLGGGRQRAVLALLLLRLGEVVSTEQLVEELWAGQPPATATKIVQLYVSRLRKSLGEGLLLTRSPGYVLRANPENLDAHRFERRFEEGRRALAGGDPALAATKLREALSLWSGPALADFLYEPFAQGEIARLEDLRLGCLEERIEAELALGSHAELVGELEAHVTAHPLRERPRGQLMLALYRSGRQAEALAAYQAARQALVDQLGIEPSPSLQRLERAILNQESELDLPELARPPPAAPVEPARPEPALEEPRPSEAAQERKLATAIFVDLVGSTELGEGDPERTRALLERFYDAMATEIQNAGGTVEKFAGDAIMAIFGAPSAQEDHAVRALHAALAMRDRLAELFRGEVTLHIGVDTGEVVVARPRQGSSFATGNAVNVAARLEQAAAPGEILVGERTVAAARGAFAFDEPMIVEAKGKAGGVACRRLLRALSLERPRGVRDLPRAFVGRTNELELLRAAYRRAVRDAQPHLLTIMGEAGVGKTTLIRELWRELHEEAPAVGRLTGRCLAYGHGITYWPLGEILKQHLGLLEDDPPETILERLGDRRVLGLTLGLDVAGDLHPLEARESLHAAWVELLGELAAERPCVVLVEDLHWAEEPLLDLFERLLLEVRGPVFLVGTARPELLGRRPAWAGGRRNAASLWLEPLSEDETGELVESLLGTELAQSLSELVLGRAEGNPFFVEELLATLIDTGVIVRENGGWVAREVAFDPVVPDSIQATLASRIDLLPAREKAALQAAAVAGRVFWASPVAELLGEEPDYALLEERDFVRQQRVSSLAGEREFWIKHALTREVAYASLPKTRRARLHAAFAAWIEGAGGGRDEHAPLLAHHYGEAVRPEDADFVWADEHDEHARLCAKAVTWLRRAAELAAGRYEIREALALLEQALSLTRDVEAKIGLLRAVGRVHTLNFDAERFRAAMEEALSLGPDPAVAGEIYAQLAYYGHGRPYLWKQPPPVELGEHWLARALELAPPGTEARAQALLARAFGTPEAEGGAAEEAFELAKALDNPALLVFACEAQGLAASTAGRFQEASLWADRALEAVPGTSDPGLRLHQHWVAGFAHLRAGRVADVAALSEECDRLAVQLTPHDQVHAAALQALLHATTGRWQELIELAATVQATAEGNKETPCQFNWRSFLVCALGFAHLGNEREARRLEEQARASAIVAGPPEREPALLRLALLHGDLEEAEQILKQLAPSGDVWGLDAAAARLDALVALGDRLRVEEEAAPFLENQSYTRPFAVRALGIVRDDEQLVDQAVARFEAMGLDWQAAETRRLAGAR